MIMCLRNRLDPSQQQRYGRKLGRVNEVEEQVEELVDGEVLLGVLLQVVGDHVSHSGGGGFLFLAHCVYLILEGGEC